MGMKLFLPLLLLATCIECLKTPNTKAASPYTNCGCQCSNLTFKDKYGATHGNCHSADQTGAVWCYVDPNQASSCQDLAYTSVRFPGKPWSYEACATPACGNNGPFVTGTGGFTTGASSGSGGFGSSNCKGSRCFGGSASNGFNSGAGLNGGNCGGFNNGYNGVSSGSSNCRGSNCGSGVNNFGSGFTRSNSHGLNSGTGFTGSNSNGFNSGSGF